MIGRPPISSIQLKYHGRVLAANDDDDDECINDLLEDYDSDDEDDDDTDTNTIGEDEDDDEDTIKLSLVADIVPPIDSKFGIEFRDRVHKMSTKEILEAYCINMAGMVYGQELHVKECELYNDTQDEGDEDDEEEEEHTTSSSTAAATENHSLNIRKKAALLQSQFESTLSDETKQLINEEHERVKNASSSTNAAAAVAVEDGEVVYGLVPQGSGSAVRSHRKGRTLKGGATMNVKRSLQRNLNVVCLVCLCLCCVYYPAIL
jgi:hypothetical protein